MISRTLAAALLLGAAPAAAVQPVQGEAAARATAQPAAPAVDPARLEAAQRLIDLMWPAELFTSAMSATMASGVSAPPPADPEAAARDPHHAERARLSHEASAREFERLFREFMPELRAATVRIYARRLSVEDLEQAIRFYSSPGGRRFVAGGFEMAMDPESMRAFDAIDPAIAAQIEAELSDLPRNIVAATAHLPPLPGLNEALAAVQLQAVGAGEPQPADAEAETTAAPAPSPPLPPADPARLAAARRAVDAIWPSGALGQPLALQPVADLLVDTPIASFGFPIPENAGLRPETTFGQVLAGFDPHYRERLRIVLDLLSGEMGRVLAIFEPQYKNATAVMYAHQFTVAELDEVSRFFRTPAGQALARESSAVLGDAESMREMLGLLPRAIAAAHPAMQRIEQATAHLPPPPEPEEAAD